MALPSESSAPSRQELLEAQAHVFNHVLSFANSMCLTCAIELDIPDVIHKHGHPMTLSQLANALPINKSKSHALYSLMRILTHAKFFEKVNPVNSSEDSYSLTQASRLLVRDGPNGPANAGPVALFLSDPILTGPWHRISEWFQNDDFSSFVTKHGRTIWEHAGVDQRFNMLFNDAMVHDSMLVNSVLVEECKDVFEGLRSMVDVGGGTGATAKGIAAAFPGLKCTVLELLHVVAGLEGSETDNVSFAIGDMFDYIPQADAIFLKLVLHAFSDEDCVKVLKKCREAVTPSKNNGGKVILVEIVVGDQEEDDRATQTQLFFDMQMVVQLAAKERTEKEWANLFYDAGFNNYKISPVLGLRSVIEVFP